MKWKCFFGRHNWDYSWESTKFVSASDPKNTKNFMVKVRYCNECSKKQRNSYNPLNGVLGENRHWINYNNLTVDQVRDKKLNGLGL